MYDETDLADENDCERGNDRVLIKDRLNLIKAFLGK